MFTSQRTPLALSCVLAGLSGIGGDCIHAEDALVVYDGFEGPGRGKHIVLISGDEEYRSEEAVPQLGKILSKHHGFKCTVLFAINKKTGEIDPQTSDNIPGLEALKQADLMVIFTRFRSLPADQMKHIDDYLRSGRPVVGMRTATHAFRYTAADHPYAKWDFHSKQPGFQDGFGRQILGETWIAHHGVHGKQSTRGVIAGGMEKHPIVRGCKDIWGPTDVYAVRLPLPGDSVSLVLGYVLQGMKPTDKPVQGEQNNPVMPIAWIKTYEAANGKRGRVFTTTMGASQDLESEGLRRLIVNGCYWAVGLEEKIPARAKVDLVGEYKPTRFRFAGHKRGVRPREHRMKSSTDARSENSSSSRNRLKPARPANTLENQLRKGDPV